jgi:hypothetical protein
MMPCISNLRIPKEATKIKSTKITQGQLFITCPKCGLDRGQEVAGLGKPCPRCNFKPKIIPYEEWKKRRNAQTKAWKKDLK